MTIGQNTQPEGNTQPPIPEGEQKPTKVEFTPEQQEIFNAAVADEARKAAKKAAEDVAAQLTKDFESKQDEAMKAALREQKNFEKLNAVLEDDNKNLRADVERLEDEVARLRISADKYEDSVRQDYTAFVATMPAALRAFDPGPEAPLDRQRAFLEMARAAQAEMGAPFQPGTPPSPPPQGPPNSDEELIALEKAALRRNRAYSSLSYG